MVVYFSLGTNLGDKEQNLRMAVQKIRKQIGEVISLSAFMLLPRGAFLPIIFSECHTLRRHCFGTFGGVANDAGNRAGDGAYA